jgi:putative DNA primase/helicase
VITETTGEITLIPENIPEELAERDQWVCWRLLERDGSMTKIPYVAGEDEWASSADSLTWRTFDEALASYERGGYDGIGFVFSSGDPFVGIDLDDCRDPESGEIAPWAKKIITRVQEGYIEASPSGTGVHIIVEGTVRDGRTRKEVHEKGKRVGRVEMYSRSKFFTITGDLL